MNKNKALLIMAGGMGSRFANTNNEQKQTAKVGPNGEYLIDYSIYDAIAAGFTKVVFVIKNDKEQLGLFQETIGNDVEKFVKVEYVLQDMKDIPQEYSVPSDAGGYRTKPWGTAHAIMMAQSVIQEPFLVINADDFYGKDSYKVAADFLDNNEDDNCYAVVGYQVKNTLSENGTVKRGVCLNENQELTDLIESKIGRTEDGSILAIPLDSSKTSMKLDDDSLVSMNMLCFMPSIFEHIERKLPKFLDDSIKNNPMESEFLIPDVLGELRREGTVKVLLNSTTSNWYGMTYYEDKKLVSEMLNEMVKKGEYPIKLWDDKGTM